MLGATGSKIGFYGVTPVVQPAGTDQAAVTFGNTDGEIGGLTISDPPTQTELQTLRDNWPMTSGRSPRSFTPCGGRWWRWG